MSFANDIEKRIDIASGADVNYKETTTWYDGTTITDAKCDGVIYKKLGTKFYRKVIASDIIPKVDTVAQLRSFNGYFEGQQVLLLGYFASGDKTSTCYKFTVANFSTNVDNGGTIIKTNKGSWIASSITQEWVDVEHFGIFPGKNTTDDITFASNQVKTMVQLGLKMKFNKGDYYINSITFTTNVSFVFIKGQSERKYNSITGTRILTQGNNFMVFNYTQNTFIYLYNMIIDSVGGTGSCFEKIQPSGDSDFSVIGNAFSIRLFEKAIYTPSYGTGFNIQDCVFENNKYAIYCGKATNIARIVKVNFLANQYSFRGGGYNTVIEQIQLSVNYPFLPAGEKCIGISVDYATIRDLYNEEYGGSAGITPETHILIQHRLTYIPTNNEGLLRMERVGFPANDSLTHLDIDHTATSISPNKIIVIADADKEIPRVISTGGAVKLVQGIQVNGNNITRAGNGTTLRTTQFYNYVEAKVVTPFATYTDVNNSGIVSKQIDIQASNIDGHDLMINTNYVGGTINNTLYDTTRKGIRPNTSMPFLMEYDFTLMVTSEITVCLVLNNAGVSERIATYKSVQIGSTGNWMLKIKGSFIRTAGNAAFYIASLGFDTAFTVPTTTELATMTGFYHLRSFPPGYYSTRQNRNGLMY